MNSPAKISDTGVVHQYVQLPECSDCLGDDLSNMGFIRDGTCDSKGTPLVHSDAFDNPFQLFLAPTRHDD